MTTTGPLPKFHETRDNLLPIASGDTVTMTWPAFAPGCESLGIGLSVKISQSTSFNENDNQYLRSFSYCGPEGPTCATPASISIEVPSAALVPCFQLDAHIGPPLALVGPAGAYYASGLAPHASMLISAFNGGAEPCAVPSCSTSPGIPAAAVQCTAQVTTTVPATSTPTSTPTPTPLATSTTAPTTTTGVPGGSGEECAVSASATAAATGTSDSASVTAGTSSCELSTACAPGLAMDAAATGQCLDASAGNVGRQVAIPVTGSRPQPLVLLAGILLGVGAPLTLLFRRPGARRSRA